MTLHFANELRGKVLLPASKSISNRVLFINATLDAPCRIDNLSQCDDTDAMLRVVNGEAPSAQPISPRSRKGQSASEMADLFGCVEENSANTQTASKRIDIGAAGTAMRFATALLATREGQHFLLDGTARMRQRPIRVLVDALRSIGADISYTEQKGFPPLLIHGSKLTGTTVELSADVSSQYVSALLMLGPLLPHGLQVKLRGEIASRPYINLTIGIMERFGARAMWIGESTLYVHSGGYHRTEPFRVEQDWSAASYWYELMALTPDSQATIQLPGLTANSMQGDSRVAELFSALGVQTQYDEQGVTLTKVERPEDLFLHIDLSEQPDLAQTLVVTCAMLRVPFHFEGLQSLRIKETDRLAALQTELAKLGIEVQIRLDSEMLWDGHVRESLPIVQIDTYDDHRMAMAFAPCAMLYDGLVINHPEVVSKSYPTFWETLQPFLSQS